MNITIDTSALIAIIGNEKSKGGIIDITTGCSLCSPISVHWEVGNALSAMFKRKSINLEQANLALAAYAQIPIKFVDVPLAQTIELTHTHQIYAYDAYIIQCAQTTSTPLLTLDAGLKRVAIQVGIKTLEIQ
jgi:predicted nucleic acid-binding protein